MKTKLIKKVVKGGRGQSGGSQVSGRAKGVQKIINIKKKIICNIIKSYKSYTGQANGEKPNGEMKMFNKKI